MKLLILIASLLITLSPAVSQTNTQIAFVDRFFNNNGGNILQDAAHPACTWSYATVRSYTGHIYHITLHYTQVLTSKEFSCEYRLKLSPAGRFLSLENWSCNSSNFKCFAMCRFIIEGEDPPGIERRSRYESYTGKSFDLLNCEEHTSATLFFDWEDYGYYAKY